MRGDGIVRSRYWNKGKEGGREGEIERERFRNYRIIIELEKLKYRNWFRK